jgi:hypothetical protein
MLETAAPRDETATAWDELRAHLDTRARSLSQEVRLYPGPIAACDVQLTHLLEQRSQAIAQAALAAASDPSLLGQLSNGDDPLGRELAKRLTALLAPQRRRA